MRIFLLPISTRRTLLYCSKSSLSPSATPSIQDRIVARANTIWADWEREPSGWKKTLTTYGNRAFSRIPYQEWGLKTLPALHADSHKQMSSTGVEFPSSLLPQSQVQPTLHRLAHERQTLHRTRMWWSIAGLPLALPFGLIPIVPNVPFFYLAFRAWSHYKALYGAQYLAVLLEGKHVVPKPNEELDRLYASGSGAIAVRRAGKRSFDAEKEKEFMLLDPEMGRTIAEKLSLPAIQVEIERAVDQVKADLEKAANEEKEKAANQDKEKKP
ncbi:hypothetical protein ANO11243_065600 [Dothideomycetidae sp. 11243]|nr:hypothetical protein ANO11243_065600 [fungal sp. No.11243]